MIRPSIAKLEAYRSARSIATEANVFLDANEAPGPAPDNWNRYPSPQPPALLERFAAIYGVNINQVLVGRGSDEAIDVLTRAFCEPGSDEILISSPTYGMYKVSAGIQNASVADVPLVFDGMDWRLDVAGMRERLQQGRVKLAYVCSPNNPTGTLFKSEDIRALCSAASGQALVVVDEAYIEFAPQFSSVPLLNEFSNLVVLRTLSKAWALAGLRCGVALASPEVIQVLRKVLAPYPLPRPVIDAVGPAINAAGESQMNARVSTLISERERLRRALSELSTVETIFPSSANFLLVRFTDEKAVMNAAAAAGIILRSRNTEPGLKNCVRITVGNESENDLLLNTLAGKPRL